MKYLTKENFFMVLIALILFGQGLNYLKPSEGVTAEQINRIIKLKESDNRVKELEKDYKLIIERDEIIEKSVNVDSIIIWDATRKYRDSIRTSINPS
jgi:hypothetical protein